MTLDLIIVGWFLCGLLGLHMGMALDPIPREEAGSVWLVLFGPILMIFIVFFIIDRLSKLPEKEK